MLGSNGKPFQKYGPIPEQARFTPIVLLATMTVGPGSLAGGSPSVIWMLVRVTLPATWLRSRPNQSGVTSLTVRLPPIVLFLIAQGIDVVR